jgi:hypothetical protein
MQLWLPDTNRSFCQMSRMLILTGILCKGKQIGCKVQLTPSNGKNNRSAHARIVPLSRTRSQKYFPSTVFPQMFCSARVFYVHYDFTNSYRCFLSMHTFKSAHLHRTQSRPTLSTRQKQPPNPFAETTSRRLNNKISVPRVTR